MCRGGKAADYRFDERRTREHLGTFHKAGISGESEVLTGTFFSGSVCRRAPRAQTG
jgi:hypothetical protein